MQKLRLSNRRVTCGSCRHFDGLAWCGRWNFHTEAGSPICDRYRALPTSRVPGPGSPPEGC